jgi:hypothetical protein
MILNKKEKIADKFFEKIPKHFNNSDIDYFLQ